MTTRKKNIAYSINGEAVNFFACVPVPIVIVQDDGAIRRFTAMAANVLRLESSDVGRNIDEFVPLGGLISEVVVTGSLREIEVQDWTGAWHRIMAAPWLTRSGTIEGAAVAILNIEDLKRAQAELKVAHEGIAGANRVKDDFLAVLSHELRTPLTTVLGWTQELRSTGDLPKGVADALSVIERSAHAQGQLINDLLDISRIQAGKLTIEGQVVDVVEVLKHSMEVARSQADKKSISINLESGLETCMIFADLGRVRQIFWNVLNNAIKFTPDEGKIRVTLKVTVSGKDKFAQVRFIDSGVGIKKEFLPRIFDRFSQGDSSATRNHGGLGLGLALVKSLVEMQDGLVTAESSGEGEGATFTILLPLVSLEDLPVLRKVPEDENLALPTDLKGVRVVVVDDDACNLELFAAMLRSSAIEVQIADSAAHAFRAVTDFKPDVLISDIAMPVEDGISLIHKIRHLDPDHGGQVPAIALTAYASSDDVRRVLKAGFSAHVAKPVNKATLLQAIAKLLRAPDCFH